METIQNIYLKRFAEIAEKLPEKKWEELIDYALFLIWQSKEMKNNANEKEQKENSNLKQLTIPFFYCNGMN
jgi:hypothetical protein